MVKRGKENKIVIVISLFFACLISQGYADDHFSQGKLLYDSGKYEQAIEEFSKAIDLNPKNADAFIGRGRSYLHILETPDRLNPFPWALHSGSFLPLWPSSWRKGITAYHASSSSVPIDRLSCRRCRLQRDLC